MSKRKIQKSCHLECAVCQKCKSGDDYTYVGTSHGMDEKGQVGSHNKLEAPNGVITIIPMADEIPKGTRGSIIRMFRLTGLFVIWLVLAAFVISTIV